MTQEISEPSLTLLQLQQFFEERKGVININPIAEEAELSDHHLREMLKGERVLTEKSVVKLLPVLERHGYQYKLLKNAEISLTLEALQQFFKGREKTIHIGPLGEEAGLSPSYLNRIVRGEKGLTQKTIIKVLPILYKYGYKK